MRDGGEVTAHDKDLEEFEVIGTIHAVPAWLAVTPADLCDKCEQKAYGQVFAEGLTPRTLIADGWHNFQEHAGMYKPCSDCTQNKAVAKNPVDDKVPA